MELLHVTSFEREGVEWHVGLREISRELSPTGLALVFSTAWGPRAGSPILWPVTATLLEDLLDTVESRGASRLVQELEAALKWHRLPQDGSSSSPELGPEPTDSSVVRVPSR